jgi:hypothetical protein
MKLKPDTIYSERYNEMRRFRDYELTASTWYSAIFLAIFGLIVASKFQQPHSFIACLLSSNHCAQLIVAAAVTLIGWFSIYSVCYVGYRYHVLRHYMDLIMEPLSPIQPRFKPRKFCFQPRDAIFFTQLIIIGASDLAIFAPLILWCGAIALILGITSLLCIRKWFRDLEKQSKEELYKMYSRRTETQTR